MKKRINKILIGVLLFIFLINLYYLYIENNHSVVINYKNHVNIDTDEEDKNNTTNIKLLVKRENEKAREKLHYMNLYPDMYVDSIKPIIHLEETKIAYLTFDDGPSENTNHILDTLWEYDVKATFFVIGSEINKEEEEILKSMVQQGHTLGIHTYSHDYERIYSSVESYLHDFYQVYKLLYNITGIEVKIFRFPWGSNNGFNKSIKEELISEMERRGFTFYDWNVSAEDSIGKPTKYRIKKNVMNDLEKYNNPIILMHDGIINSLTAKTLPDIIVSIQEKGYDFDTLDHREPYQFPNYDTN